MIGVLAVPPWRAGLEASVLPQAYRDLLEVAEHASRRIRILGATAHPTAPWVAQAARNSIMERWVQTCRRELLDRTLVCNRSHLLHALREFEEFHGGHRPHQGMTNAARSSHCPRRWRLLIKTPPFTFDDVTDGGVLHEYQHAA